MKHYYELDENDIVEIIAKFLGVTPGDVQLTSTTHSRGYEGAEYYETVITCKVMKTSAVMPPKTEPQIKRTCLTCAHDKSDGTKCIHSDVCVTVKDSDVPSHWEAITRPED